MRLTLRTLLAYLDDVLPPDQAKEMGQKLSESGYATGLVDRIKDVLRRRRLSAPEVMGKNSGIDPNLVAEYLDNELTPAEVADVEKICLDSDIHLAEVAAAHQILTIVLGEPVEVRPELRSRMYALGPVPLQDKVQLSEEIAKPAPPEPARPIPSVAPTVAVPHSRMTEESLADLAPSGSSWKQTGVLVLVLLIGIGWVGLLMRDDTVTQGLRSTRTTRSTETLPDADASAGASSTELDHASESGSDTKIASIPNESPRQDSKASVVASNSPTKTKELPIEEPLVAEPESPRKTVTKVEPPVTPEAPATKPMPPQPKDVAPVDEPPSLPAARLIYVSKEGVLLHFQRMVNDYLVLPHRSELRPGDRLASPEPFRADIIIGEDACLVALNGGTSVRCLPPTDRAMLGFHVHQGTLVFESRGLAQQITTEDGQVVTPNGKNKALAIRLAWGSRSGLLELASDDALCGLEVRRHEPTQFETELEPPEVTAGLYVARGVIRLTNDEGQTVSKEGPGVIPLTADFAANMKASEIGRASQLVFPDWLEADAKRALAKLKRPYNTPFEKEFDPEQPLLLSVPAIVNNPRPALSELAVKCLALTDSYQPLIKTLIQAEHRESRLAAITGLRQWLPLDSRNQVLLKNELSRYVLPSEAEAIYRLLWGFNAQDARDPKISRALVDWLDSEQLAIRELAFWHVQRLTGLKHEYSPVNPPGQRRAAVERWHMHLDKKGGALIQE